MTINLNGSTGITTPNIISNDASFTNPINVGAPTEPGQAAVNDLLQGKNKIIGGDLSTNPWQRGTSFTSNAGNYEYYADRFSFNNQTAAVLSILKTADAPTAAQSGVFTQHCLHADVTTADASIAATDVSYFIQLIEGLNAKGFGFGQAGTRYVTLSFWHKHTKTGIHCVSIQNDLVATRSYVVEYSQAVSDTWEKAVITIPVDTSGTWLYDTGIGLRLIFVVAAGSTYQTAANAWSNGQFYATANQVNNLDSTANNFKIALVQLEAGQVPTRFEDLDVGTVKRLCERYFESSYPDGQASGSYLYGFIYVSTGFSTTAIPGTAFRTRKRLSPTVNVFQPVSGAANNIYRVGDGATVGVSTVDYISVNGFGQISTTAFAQNGYIPLRCQQ